MGMISNIPKETERGGARRDNNDAGNVLVIYSPFK
jgi:hypothetical protein